MVSLCLAHGDWIADRIGILAASRNGTQMARKQEITPHTPKSSKRSHTGYEKMQMSHARMRKDIKRILEEHAKTVATGKPKHR
jgi:hypothetical protein